MRICLLQLIFCALLCGASGREIPYYGLDSLAFQASEIVLGVADESIKKRGTSIHGFGYEYYETVFVVDRTMKGSLRTKEVLTVEVPTDYVGTSPHRKYKGVPKGKRALLFLRGNKRKYRPVTGGVKLILKGEVYCYGQFYGNPGPLYLCSMAPENFKISRAVIYDEALLLKDLGIALEKAKRLVAPIAIDPHKACRRHGYN